MNENLFNVVLNSTTQYTIRPRLCTSKYPLLAKTWYPWDHGLLRAL